MNAFKTDYINSRCYNHSPPHTVVTVSPAANCTRAGSQLVPHPLQQRNVARSAPPHISVPPNRQFTGGTRSHGVRRFAPCATRHSVRFSARDYITKCQTRSASPHRTYDQPFRRLRVLALGCGALWPSCRSEPGVVPYSARLTAPDTQVASAAANGGYWPFAACFSVGHGKIPRSTLRA